MRKVFLAVTIISIFTAHGGRADTLDTSLTNFQGGLHVSTLGIGPDIAYQFNPVLSARLTGNYFKFSRSTQVTTRMGAHSAPVDIKGELRMLTAGLVVDIRPFVNWFYVSVGAYYNGNRVDVTGYPTGVVYFDDKAYLFNNAGTSVQGKIEWRHFSPYLGLGTSWEFDRVSLNFSAGIIFQSGVNAKITKVEGLATAVNPQVYRDIEAEVTHQVHKHKLLRYYPVVSLGINIKL